jgi:hypothetical protein
MFLMGEAEDGYDMDKVRESGRTKLFGPRDGKDPMRCDAFPRAGERSQATMSSLCQ